MNEPTLYSSLIAQAKFHLAANKVLERLLSSTNLSAGEALALNNVMTPWTAALPWYFQLNQPLECCWDWYLFARSRLWWKFWNLQITLTRPFLLQWVSRNIGSRHSFDGDREEKECRSLCTSSAHNTITSIEEYIRQHSLTSVTSWYTLCVVWIQCYNACLIVLSYHTDIFAGTSCFTPLWLRLSASFQIQLLLMRPPGGEILTRQEPCSPSTFRRTSLPHDALKFSTDCALKPPQMVVTCNLCYSNPTMIWKTLGSGQRMQLILSIFSGGLNSDKTFHNIKYS